MTAETLEDLRKDGMLNGSTEETSSKKQIAMVRPNILNSTHTSTDELSKKFSIPKFFC